MHRRIIGTLKRFWLASFGVLTILLTLLASPATAHAATASRNIALTTHSPSDITWIDCNPGAWIGGPAFPYSSNVSVAPIPCPSNFTYAISVGHTTPTTGNAVWYGPYGSGHCDIYAYIPDNHAGANARYWLWDGNYNQGYRGNVYLNQENYTGWTNIAIGVPINTEPVVSLNNSAAAAGWDVAAYAVGFYCY